MPTIFDSNRSIRFIHPAVDVVDGVFFVGVGLPYQDEENGKVFEGMLHFVTSNRECFPAIESELAERRLAMRFSEAFAERRWELQHIADYLAGVSGDVMEPTPNVRVR